MSVQVKALFKQTTVKGGTATLQMKILTDEPGAFDLIEMSGQTVFLKVTPEQETFEFDSETGEIIR
jgi:hypothetical protein